MKRCLLLCWLLLASMLFLVPAVRATVVIPPTFSKLVAQADQIVKGTVSDVSADWENTPGGRMIFTYVTIKTENILKGQQDNTVKLRFLGGTVGSETITVSDVPKFKAGDHVILFVQNNGKQFCPLVGIMYGAYRIVHDTATNQDIVTRNNGTPLRSTAEIPNPPTSSTSGQTTADQRPPMTVNDFEKAIRGEMQTRAKSLH